MKPGTFSRRHPSKILVASVSLFLACSGLLPVYATDWANFGSQITNSGKVGVMAGGLSTPLARLHVQANAGVSDPAAIIGENSSESPAAKGSILELNINDAATYPALSFWNHSLGEVASVKKDGGGYFLGNIGMGLAVPSAKLHVSVAGSSTTNPLVVGETSTGSPGSKNYIMRVSINSAANYPAISFWNHSLGEVAAVKKDGGGFFMGKVGIGTNANPSEQLEVNGNVKATNFLATNSIKIKNWSIDAPDYVFEKTYPLRSLDEVEHHIRKHKHLPEVPSAKEVKENGLDLVKMNLTLLKKVEELTLYAIAQEKRMKALEARFSGRQK